MKEDKRSRFGLIWVMVLEGILMCLLCLAEDLDLRVPSMLVAMVGRLLSCPLVSPDY